VSGPVRALLAVVPVVSVALTAAGSALAHAQLLPDGAVAEETELFTLAVPNEKDDASTTSVVLTVPDGFRTDQFIAAAGWTREAAVTGTGGEARVASVTWTAAEGGDPEGGLFQFTGEAASTGDYAFSVRQSYSDGSVVDWSGPADSDTPAPVLSVAGSPDEGGDGTTIAVVALVVGAIGVLLAGIALAARGGRTT
jgi:uncharacterized protein YcnI